MFQRLIHICIIFDITQDLMCLDWSWEIDRACVLYVHTSWDVWCQTAHSQRFLCQIWSVLHEFIWTAGEASTWQMFDHFWCIDVRLTSPVQHIHYYYALSLTFWLVLVYLFSLILCSRSPVLWCVHGSWCEAVCVLLDCLSMTKIISSLF